MITYPSPVFGPVHSRRLGVSLGINLLPADGKMCTFDCLYCECGFNGDHRPTLAPPTREEVRTALEVTLRRMSGADGGNRSALDVITFAGNGEPTCHPRFHEIIDDTIALRNRYYPEAKISVLSNGTMIGVKGVHDALMLVDNNIQKLDTVNQHYIRTIDRPVVGYSVRRVIGQLKAFRGHVIIQTMFLQSSDPALANVGEEYVAPWLDAIRDIVPQAVMVYTIDRETPDKRLLKATPAQLDDIRDRVLALGFPCTASY